MANPAICSKGTRASAPPKAKRKKAGTGRSLAPATGRYFRSTPSVTAVGVAFAVLSSLALSARAEPNKGAPNGEARSAANELNADERGRLNISPIFSELVLFSAPRDFKPVFEQTGSAGKFYIREMVLEGETVERWSQMITVTGAKGLAANPKVTAESYLESMVSGFKNVCPTTFSSKPLGARKISGHGAFIVLAGCGAVQAQGEAHSEAALLIGVKGSHDDYTIQWAVRGPPQNEPIDLSGAKWQERLGKLNPIKLCPLTPGEAAPYPSCVAQK
jgi:hypothetical protein